MIPEILTAADSPLVFGDLCFVLMVQVSTGWMSAAYRTMQDHQLNSVICIEPTGGSDDDNFSTKKKPLSSGSVADESRTRSRSRSR